MQFLINADVNLNHTILHHLISITKPHLLIAPLSIPWSHYLHDSSSLRIEFKMSFDFLRRAVSPSGWRDLHKIKLGAHCFRKCRVNLICVNLTFGKFALILFKVNFLRVQCQRASLISKRRTCSALPWSIRSISTCLDISWMKRWFVFWFRIVFFRK